MVFVKRTVALLLAKGLVLLSLRSVAAQDIAQDLVECYRNQPTPGQLCERLNEALQKHRGSDIEDDILLALAEAHIAAGRPREAIPILGRLAKDTSAQKVDMEAFWVGWGIPGMPEIRKRYDKCPDLTSDHALLALARAYRVLGEFRESWETLEELRRTHPRGDRVQADLCFIQRFRKNHPSLPRRLASGVAVSVPDLPKGAEYVALKVPRGPGTAWQLSYQFLVRRRPHLRGLQQQAAVCDKMGRSSRECIDILKDIVSIYDLLLAEDELTDYCRQGLAEIESLQVKAEGAALERLEEARKVFTQALEKLAQEKSEPSGKDQHDTGAKE